MAIPVIAMLLMGIGLTHSVSERHTLLVAYHKPLGMLIFALLILRSPSAEYSWCGAAAILFPAQTTRPCHTHKPTHSGAHCTAYWRTARSG